MTLLVDFQIEKLCSKDGFERTWVTSVDLDTGAPSEEIEIENAGPMITPFDPVFLSACAYDIRLGLKYASPSPIQAFIVRRIGKGVERLREVSAGCEIDGTALLRNNDELLEVILEPKQVVLCHSAEYVRMSPTMRGILSMRSSFARDWLDHSAADNIWPGFQGEITFELRNDGPRPIS